MQGVDTQEEVVKVSCGLIKVKRMNVHVVTLK